MQEKKESIQQGPSCLKTWPKREEQQRRRENPGEECEKKSRVGAGNVEKTRNFSLGQAKMKKKSEKKNLLGRVSID